MDAPVDLYSASREDLIALLLAQRERLADQEQDLARLRAEVATQQAAMAALQERVGVLLAILDPPDGDDPASRPTTMPGRVEVTEHIYLERRFPRCRGRWLPAPELDGVVIGQRRLGIGLLSLMARVREELRLPIAGIQGYLDAVHGRRLSVGAIVGALHTVAAGAEPVVAQPRSCSRQSGALRCCTSMRAGGGRTGTTATSGPSPLRRSAPSSGESGARGAGARDRGGLQRGAGQRRLRGRHLLLGAPPVLLGASAARCP